MGFVDYEHSVPSVKCECFNTDPVGVTAETPEVPGHGDDGHKRLERFSQLW